MSKLVASCFARGRLALLQNVRNAQRLPSFVRMSTEKNIKAAEPPKEPAQGTQADVHDVLNRRLHSPNKLEQRLLVWTGRYKSLEEVPKNVPVEAIEKSRNKARIRVANYMMVLTLLACIAVAISGRRAAERGESVSKMNLEWHRKINEEAAAAAAAKKAE